MPSYILNPDGSITNKANNEEVDRVALASYMKRDDTGHYGNNRENFTIDGFEPNFEAASQRTTNLTLPAFSSDSSIGLQFTSDSVGDYIIGRTGKPDDEIEMAPAAKINSNGEVTTFSSGFVKRKDKNFLLNPSFGADQHQTFYKSLNNYLFNGEIFATEIEMLAGVDFNSAGFRDLTRFWFFIDYIIESAIYIATIEAWLALEQITLGLIAKSEYKNVDTDVLENYTIALGNYGPVSYTKMSYFINEVLQYPKTKSSQGPLDRIGAFYTGLTLYVNSDPQILYDKLKGDTVNGLLEGSTISPVPEAAGYLLDSLLSLTNIGEKKLIALIRRFHQKSWWHKNILYKAKDTDFTQENVTESYFAELSYYYVKFAIERMHVGLKFKNYRRRNKVQGRLNRSGKYREAKENKTSFLSNDIPGSIANIATTGSIPQNTDVKFNTKQSMAASLLPQAFILPESLIRSYYLTNGINPENDIVEAHVLKYFKKTKKRQQRLDNATVKALEDYYEKEMVPFYFHDMRTNEVIGFHAFIESLTDNFNVNYNSTKGFGRIDDVMHYVDTKRNISLTFMLAATSKEDHDFIWYQVNKLVSMCYPQWSDGYTKSKTGEAGNSYLDYNQLSYPFSQVPTASPLIRLRVGDLIKSNYTDHAINKIHGVGNFDWELDKNILKKNINLSVNNVKDPTKAKNDGKRDAVYYLLPGTYYNQITGEEIHVNELLNISSNEFKASFVKNYMGGITTDLEGKKEEIEEETSEGTTIKGQIYYKIADEANNVFLQFDEKYTTIFIKYQVEKHKVMDNTTPNYKPEILETKTVGIFKVDNLSVVTYYPLFKTNLEKVPARGGLQHARTININEKGAAKKTTMTNRQYFNHQAEKARDYVKPFDNGSVVNNPITAAYETTKGRGLAGFLTMMDINTQDQTWETEVVGSKAPKVIKISVNFSPIHDIQPGLDSDGAMRAPVYNTGKIINKLYGKN